MSEKKQRLVPGSMYIPPTPTHLPLSKTSPTPNINTVNPSTSRAFTPNKQLGEFLRSIEPSYCLQPAVEELLLEMATEFVDDVVSFSSRLTKHRRSTVLDAKDLQFCLAKNYGIALPGVLKPTTGYGQASRQPMLNSLGSDASVRPRSARSSIHMHRVALKRKLLQRTAKKIKQTSSSSSNSTKKIVHRKANTDTVDASQ